MNASRSENVHNNSDDGNGDGDGNSDDGCVAAVDVDA